MSSGHSFRNDRSGAETSNLRVPAGLENTKKMVSDWIPSFCVSFRARDGTRTRGLDLGKVALHQLSHSRKERVMGIEPTYPAWKAGVLPLNYTRMGFPFLKEVGVTGFEPATSWSQTRRSSQAEPHPEGILFFLLSQVFFALAL